MKVAVINFSGNVGKTTICRHLLQPRIPGAELVSIESINQNEGLGHNLRGRQFSALQDYLNTVEHAVVDIGASNVEDFLGLMEAYEGSHQDFDAFVIPTVPPTKQQQDTIATLVELAQLGIDPRRLRVIFNMVEKGTSVVEEFYLVLAFLKENPIAIVDPACSLRLSEIYGRLRTSQTDLNTWLNDTTDYKALIATAADSQRKLELTQKLGNQRLAKGVSTELDACFVALRLDGATPTPAKANAKGTS